jgi:hypothetical protein
MADTDNIPPAPQSASRKRGRRPGRVSYPRFEVIVDAATIARGIQRNSRHCPVAEATNACGTAAGYTIARVAADTQTLRLTDARSRLRYAYLTPGIAAWFIYQFDQGVALPPFRFRLGKAISITRVRPVKDLNISDEERIVRHAQREKEYRARRKRTRSGHDFADGPSKAEPFKPATADRAAVLAAMSDPTAPLGPYIAIDAANASSNSVPVLVGGLPPRHLPFRKSTRKFGARELAE